MSVTLHINYNLCNVTNLCLQGKFTESLISGIVLRSVTVAITIVKVPYHAYLLYSLFQTHPSVRIKGTENNYEPVACMSSTCPNKMNPHMHCPFCVKTDFYMDPVILKAHYRVKHVDKGIEFAG